MSTVSSADEDPADQETEAGETAAQMASCSKIELEEAAQLHDQAIPAPIPPPSPSSSSSSSSLYSSNRPSLLHQQHSQQSPLISCRTGRKVRRNPGVLVKWIYLHERNYYPTKSEKEELCREAGMTIRQLNDWFANARRNIKKKGMEYWKKKHSPYSARLTQPDGGLFLPHIHGHPDLGYHQQQQQQQQRASLTPSNSPLPPPAPSPMSYHTHHHHLAMVNSLPLTSGNSQAPAGGACANLLSPASPAVDNQTPVAPSPPSTPAYYPSYLNCKPLPYHHHHHAALASGIDGIPPGYGNLAVPPNSPPVFLDGFFHPLSQSPRAFKVYSPGVVVPQHFTPHPCAYKLPGPPYRPSSPSQLSQLSTGSNPYSDNMSPPVMGMGINCKMEADSPPSCAVNPTGEPLEAAAAVAAAFHVQVKEEEQVWVGGDGSIEPQESPGVAYSYQPNVNWGAAVPEGRAYWANGELVDAAEGSAAGGGGGGGGGGYDGSGGEAEWNPKVPPPEHQESPGPPGSVAVVGEGVGGAEGGGGGGGDGVDVELGEMQMVREDSETLQCRDPV